MNKRFIAQSCISAASVLGLFGLSNPGRAQTQMIPSDVLPPQDIVPPQAEPQPELPPLQELPPAEELLESPPNGVSQPPLQTDGNTFEIERFEFINNTAFDDERLRQETDEFIGEDKTFADVAAARSAVTQLYLNEGYVTSDAIVPPQQVVDGVVEIQIVEGSLSEIVVNGTHRLNPGYVSSRIALGAAAPLDVDRLVDRLQLLQRDPLIRTISADLQATPQPGTNRLVVDVVEANSFGVTYTLDNNRSPSVGTLRNQVRITEANLTGLGDSLSLGYTLTSGSDGFDIDYTVPISPHDGTFKLAVNLSDNEVVEEPFDVLEIDSDSDYYELTLRHPLGQTPTEEFALGLTASHQRSQTSLGIDDIGPTRLSPGADDEGRTRVSALRFFQEWTQRSPEHVLAVRSQFNVGLDFLGATVNDDAPDSRFFSWQGQAQWVRAIGPDALLLLRGSTQLSADPLLSLEQLNLGGQSTVRGYRQNLLSTDNGVLGTVEVRLPLWRDRAEDRLLQITPFLDAGYGWNVEGENPDPLVGVGLGLLFQQRDLTARFDWGIPLIDSDTGERDSLQENGLYFTLQYSFF